MILVENSQQLHLYKIGGVRSREKEEDAFYCMWDATFNSCEVMILLKVIWLAVFFLQYCLVCGYIFFYTFSLSSTRSSLMRVSTGFVNMCVPQRHSSTSHPDAHSICTWCSITHSNQTPNLTEDGYPNLECCVISPFFLVHSPRLDNFCKLHSHTYRRKINR